MAPTEQTSLWVYDQRTGLMSLGSDSFSCYAGNGDGLNNPAMQFVHDVGPLPQGWYTIKLPPVDTATHGPYVMWLEPDPDNQMGGRSAFGIHGDKVDFITHPKSASDGCIVTAHANRIVIATSACIRLLVIASEGPSVPVS